MMIKNRNRGVKQMAGFTLIELMIVVVIVGLLTAISYPNYTAYVERGKRSEGRALLLEVANRMERMYSDCNAYPAALATAGANNCGGTGTVVIPSLTSESGYYTIANPTAASLGANRQAFILVATPTFTTSDCTTLTLGSDGTRGSTGGKTVEECWGK